MMTPKVTEPFSDDSSHALPQLRIVQTSARRMLGQMHALQGPTRLEEPGLHPKPGQE